MRAINYIVLHCTATPQSTTIESMLNYWKKVLKWSAPGYHFVIKPDGEAVNIQPIEKIANGVAGHNKNSIHISYIGGVDKNLNPVDNRTKEQKLTQFDLVRKFLHQFPGAEVLGHTDFHGVSKDCPCFSVKDWLECTGL